ncbi:MAG TPA: monovalent cation/H+ antiporter complex subunit F [Nitrospiria bacterium]|jgi:multicomponent Na+:H+ antiporter subunit F
MSIFFLGILLVLATIILIYLYRVLQGPTVFDRLLGLNGISSKAIMLLVIIGTLYERVPMFVDIAVGYALINLVGALAAAKYLEHKDYR